MRNVIRDILTNWHNPLGKLTANPNFPYETEVTVNPFSFTVYNGYGHGALDIQYTMISGGTEVVQQMTSWVEGGSTGAVAIYPDIGSTFKIEVLSGVCVALEVNGVFIFDDR